MCITQPHKSGSPRLACLHWFGFNYLSYPALTTSTSLMGLPHSGITHAHSGQLAGWPAGGAWPSYYSTKPWHTCSFCVCARLSHKLFIFYFSEGISKRLIFHKVCVSIPADSDRSLSGNLSFCCLTKCLVSYVSLGWGGLFVSDMSRQLHHLSSMCAFIRLVYSCLTMCQELSAPT